MSERGAHDVCAFKGGEHDDEADLGRFVRLKVLNSAMMPARAQSSPDSPAGWSSWVLGSARRRVRSYIVKMHLWRFACPRLDDREEVRERVQADG